MKSVVLLIVLALTQSVPITQEYLDKLKTESSFEVYATPEEHPFKDTEDVTPYLGLDILTLQDTSKMELGVSNTELPEEFDSRVNWPTCIHPIRNQLHCGSCWAHGASEVLSDRLCIASEGKVDVILSPQDLVSCDFLDKGCNGGSLLFSSIYLKFYGVVTDECKPYTSGNGTVAACDYYNDKCTVEGVEYKKYKASSFYMIRSINELKEDILNHGPIETGFYVYDDFMNYKSGVYKRTKGSVLKGGHAVKIIGWGKEDDTEYWIVANSWGPEWGENGFFRIAFGECGIENVMSGLPQL